MSDNKVRLQKFMAESGVASRRKSEELIAAGKVRINGVTAKIGDKVDPKHDKITLSGKKLVKEKKTVYLMLNKPRGYITTMNDERDRKCVAQLIKDVGVRVYPVGRLDRESEGLLLFTNDGDFANSVTHPSVHIPKTYRVTIRPGIEKSQEEKFRKGIEIDGRVTAPADIKVISAEDNRTVAEVTIYEGRNRQIRKMFEYFGIEVARLKRTKIGKVKLGMLKQGEYRELTEDEIQSLLSYSE
ncbi:MAG: rRNA pseudouridine synthase [Ruminococcaceae bacterium]|nr:rRNA pseudouridine synthase [Oscillospiraceae bacterium]